LDNYQESISLIKLDIYQESISLSVSPRFVALWSNCFVFLKNRLIL